MSRLAARGRVDDLPTVMVTRNESNPLSKVYYRPIEAAIRWSGLARHERQILEVLKQRRAPEQNDFPRWPALRLNTERIFDAIINKELPYGINGITVHDESGIEHLDLTVRHVDLKSWMTRYYPEQRPDFLFSQIEREAHPTISIEAIQALLFERDTLRSQLAQRDRELDVLRNTRRKSSDDNPAPIHADRSDESLGIRAETTYLHIVGGVLDLLLGHSPSGQAYSSFRTQEAIISAMVAQHGERLGISQRTLESKFAAARRALSE